MTLPTPRLDDRTFQDLVDEAKRHVQRRCPAWTDHNVSDPGVTLIETFAWMTELLMYRVNRVPDRMHLAFLDLLGVQLFPPRAARAEVTFRLSSHHDEEVVVPAGTVVSTRRAADRLPVAFTTLDPLVVPPATSRAVVTVAADGRTTDRTTALGVGDGFTVFGEPPVIGDALYVGLDVPAPSSLVLVQVVCRVGGHGIDPRRPPLVWEAWTPDGWQVCDVERDDTLGLNVPGAVELHVPAGHERSTLADVEAAWLRCRVVRAAHAYRSSPVVVSLTAATVGGDVDAAHAEPVEAEPLGVSDGTAGQVLTVARPPVLDDPDQPVVLEVGRTAAQVDAPVTWETWRVVDDVASAGPQDRVCVLDRTTGELRFGPQVRSADGSVRAYGAVPPLGAPLRVTYRTGGGAAGNVAPRTLAVLRSSVPYLATVWNRRAATGGVDGETVAEARERGPLELRTRGRAVTAEDYVHLVRHAAPELARVHCVPVTTGPDAPGLRVLVVPTAATGDPYLDLKDLQLPDDARDRVLAAVDAARVVGFRVAVEPPSYVGVRVDARVRARPGADPRAVERAGVDALFRYFSPLTGGPDGDGWPLGRPVQPGEAHAVLARVPGVDYVEDVVLLRANPLDRSVSEPQDRITLEATHVVLSVEHGVTAVAGTS